MEFGIHFPIFSLFGGRMSASSKKVKDKDTSSISLVCYNSKDPENNDSTFLDDNNQAEIGDVENFQFIDEKHDTYDKIIDSIANRDLMGLKNSIDRLCKYYFFA